MIIKIQLFFLILSIVFILKKLIDFIVVLSQETPDPIKISTIEKICTYMSISYIITFFIILIFL